MSKMKSGWFKINRNELSDTFLKIESVGLGRPGRPPRKDVAKLLVYTITNHTDYIEVAAQHRKRGVWRTTYAEISALTGYNKRVVERGLMSLKKLQLIEIAQDYGFQEGINGAGDNRIKVPRGIEVKALFYEALAGDTKTNRLQAEDKNRAVIKELQTNTKKKVQQKSLQDSTVGTPDQDLVTRQAILIDEAFEKACAELRPTLNQMKLLGIKQIFKTHLGMLEREHQKAMKQADDEDRAIGKTSLFKAIRELANSGERFDSIPNMFDALKNGTMP